jgi:hypothetical protein
MKHYYMIMPVADVTQEIIGIVNDNSEQDLSKARKSVDGTLCVLEIYAPIPSQLRTYNVFSHERILEVMQTPEWQQAEEQQSMMGSLLNMFRLG